MNLHWGGWGGSHGYPYRGWRRLIEDMPDKKEEIIEQLKNLSFIKYLLGLSKTGPGPLKQAAENFLDALEKDTAGQKDEKFKFPGIQKAQMMIHEKAKETLEVIAQNHPTKSVQEAAKALLSKMDEAKGMLGKMGEGSKDMTGKMQNRQLVRHGGGGRHGGHFRGYHGRHSGHGYHHGPHGHH